MQGMVLKHLAQNVALSSCLLFFVGPISCCLYFMSCVVVVPLMLGLFRVDCSFDASVALAKIQPCLFVIGCIINIILYY